MVESGESGTTGGKSVSNHASDLECRETGEAGSSVSFEANGPDQAAGVMHEAMVPLKTFRRKQSASRAWTEHVLDVLRVRRTAFMKERLLRGRKRIRKRNGVSVCFR